MLPLSPRQKVKFMEDMTNAEAAKLEGATLAGLQNLGVDPEDEKTVRRLLKDGADVNAKCGYDETPLFLCSRLRT
jgi:trimethylamine:corrinoid methyltransferase-like protein